MYQICQDYGQPHVLFIEDNEDNFLMLSLALEGYGISHIGMTSTQFLFELVRHYSPKVILLDILLSDVCGFKLLKTLKRHPLTKDIPIIATTALASDQSRHQILSAGCDKYIVKPYNLDDLYQLICQYLPALPCCPLTPVPA